MSHTNEPKKVRIICSKCLFVLNETDQFCQRCGTKNKLFKIESIDFEWMYSNLESFRQNMCRVNHGFVDEDLHPDTLVHCIAAAKERPYCASCGKYLSFVH